MTFAGESVEYYPFAGANIQQFPCLQDYANARGARSVLTLRLMKPFADSLVRLADAQHGLKASQVL
jgi:hypothetical protein